MSDLRSKIIRLAHQNPELRPHLLPLVTKTAGRIMRLERMFVSAIPIKGNYAVDPDKLGNLFVPYKDTDGIPRSDGAVELRDINRSRTLFTGPEEKAGARSESILEFSVPDTAPEGTILRLLGAKLPGFKLTKLEGYRDPEDILPKRPSQEEYVSPLYRRRR
jgi:hypothetical protein